MKVTVGIPCFNASRWLAQAIQSSIDQSGVDTEVIVVDDGSADDSVEVARRFGDRIRLFEGRHRGANHARNLILENASGEWLQHLDADDYLERDKIATQLLESHGGKDADVLHSPVWVETWKGITIERSQSETSPDADIFTQWIRWHIPQTGGCLWRRDALLRIGGWRAGQPCCQEHELYLRAAIAGLRFVYVQTPGAVYRIWSDETLCRKDPVRVIEVKTALFDQLLTHLREQHLLKPIHQKEIGRACFEMARTFAKTDHHRAAAYHAAQKAKGLICPAGPAAPWMYRLVYGIAGFSKAERVARWRR